MDKDRIELLESLIIGYSGKVIPKAMNAGFFEKRGQIDLWDEFLECTKDIVGDGKRPSSVYWLWKAGGYTGSAPLCKCGCGKPVSFADKKVSEWHSASCHRKSDDFKEAFKKIDHVSKLEKYKKTMLEKYGVSYNFQRECVKEKFKHKDREAIQERVRQTCLERYGVPYGVPYAKNGGEPSKRSAYEDQVLEFVRSLGVECRANARNVTYPNEIDIWCPEQKVGIEVNGSFWHSSYDKESDRKEKWRLFQKTEAMNGHGYRLFHITDIEIKKHWPIVQSMIRSILNKCETRVYARQCTIAEIPASESKKFFEETHIQGYTKTGKTIGLMKDGLIQCAMIISKARFTEHQWEIVRFASRLNTTVVGGFSKLLKHFRKNNTGSIVSYADYSRSNGDVYRTNGFRLDGLSKPSYRWVKGWELYNRHQFMRRNLPKMLENFNPELTEVENCWNNKYRRLWDCGQLRFVLD